MAPRGSGAIVNMASICGIEGCVGHPHYSAAKAGILGFTKAAAKELIVQGIRINAVAPGFVDTSRLKGALDDGRQAHRVARTPAGRLGTPEEVAAPSRSSPPTRPPTTSARRSARTAASSPPADMG